MTRWTKDMIGTEVRRVMAELEIDRMPTCRQMYDLTGNYALSNQVCKTPGGIDGWARLLGVPVSEHASRIGWRWEEWFVEQATSRGLDVVARSTVKALWDCTVNGHTVDVKAANGASIANGTQWTWRIAKHGHVADFYALVAVAGRGQSLLICPARSVPMTCMTMRDGARSQRRRSEWLDRWDLLERP